MSIRLRFVMGVALWSTLLLGGAVWVALHLVEAPMQQLARQEQQRTLELLSDVALSALRSGDFPWLQERLQELDLRPGIREVVVSNPQRHMLAWSAGVPDAALGGQDWQSIELRDHQQVLGTLDLRIPATGNMASPPLPVAQVWAVAGAFVLLLLLGTWVIAGLVLGRLRGLGRAAEALAEGKPVSLPEQRGRDEVSSVARALAHVGQELGRERSAARGSEERFALAVQGVDDVIWDWDVGSNWMFLSPRLAEMLGYSDVEIPQLYNAWLRLIHGDDRPRVERALQQHLQQDRPFHCEFRMGTADLDWRWFLGRGQVVRDEQGQALRMVGAFTDITQTRLAAREAEEALARFRALIEALPDPVIYLDADGRWQLSNTAAREFYGIAPDQPWVGQSAERLAHSAPVLRAHLALSRAREAAVRERGHRQDSVETLDVGGGQTRLLEVTRVPLFDDREEQRGMVIIGHDITERKRAQAALFQANERAQVTLRSIADGVVTTATDGRVEYLNPVAERLLGVSLLEVQGTSFAELCEIRETPESGLLDPVAQVMESGQVVELGEGNLLRNRAADEFFINLSAAPMRCRTGGVIGAVLVLHDRTEQRELMEQLTFQASHDALTGLINRREFERRLQRLLSEHSERATQDALCYLDLDRFKVVNDSSGHAIGDELLCKIAEILQNSVRRHDTVARVGGDEFALLLEDCPSGQALEIAGKVRQAIVDYRHPWQGQTFAVGVSIGVVVLPATGGDMTQLLVRADEACYIAKEKSHERIHLAASDDIEAARRRGEMRWVTRLRQAFDDESFVLFAQPIVPLVPGHQGSRHYEILLRLKDEFGRIIGPGRFLPAAERYGLIAAVDRWVVENAIEYLAAAWHGGGHDPIDSFSINLSGVSMDDVGFLGFVKDLITDQKLPPQILCFEITETVAIANFTGAMHFINELKALGCRFSLDDFGSGFSSFSYLKNLTVDYLKIDGSFVRNMTHNGHDFAMVEAINQVGKAMNLKTIAEFVGDQDTLDRLRDIGVDYAQGFYLGTPAPLYETLFGA